MKPIALRKLKEKTKVVDWPTSISVEPSTWMSWGEVEYILVDCKVAGFLNSSFEDDVVLQSDRLPLEFFNHEVLGFANGREGEEEAVSKFLGLYGVPLARDYEAHDAPGVDIPRAEEHNLLYEEEYKLLHNAFKETSDAFYLGVFDGSIAIPDDHPRVMQRLDGIRAYVDVISDRFRSGKEREKYAIRMTRRALYGLVVSLDEVTFSLRCMQNAFGLILGAIDAEIDGGSGFYDSYAFPDINEAQEGVFVHPDVSFSLMLVNEWARPHMRICFDNPLYRDDPYAFVSTVCMQFIDAMQDPVPWRRCAKCGRLFKYQINHNKRVLPKEKHSDSPTCSKRCADSLRQSNYRRELNTEG